MITINDANPPVMSNFPPDDTFTCLDSCVVDGLPLSCLGMPQATDTCDGSVTPTKADSVSASSGLPGKVITRTWTAIDVCENAVSEVQTITINDACNFVVQDAFSGVSVEVTISIINVDGGVAISVSVPRGVDGKRTGDIRGIFFNVERDDLSGIEVTGDHVTSYKKDKGGVDRVAKDVLMKGGGKNANIFDVRTDSMLF